MDFEPTPRMQRLQQNLADVQKQLNSLTRSAQPSSSSAGRAAPSIGDVRTQRTLPTRTATRPAERPTRLAADRTDNHPSCLESVISQLQSEMATLRRENEVLREKEYRLLQAETRADMYAKQVEELKKALASTSPLKKRVRLSDAPAVSTPVLQQTLRNDALNDRLKHMQEENLELRSRLAGVTPKNAALSELNRCDGCRQLNRQKSQQASYLEDKVLQARLRADDYRRHCEQLTSEMGALKSLLGNMRAKYQKQIQQLNQHATLYKSRSERLEQWNKAAVKGFHTDITMIRDKLQSIEKEIVQLLCAAAR